MQQVTINTDSTDQYFELDLSKMNEPKLESNTLAEGSVDRMMMNEPSKQNITQQKLIDNSTKSDPLTTQQAISDVFTISINDYENGLHVNNRSFSYIQNIHRIAYLTGSGSSYPPIYLPPIKSHNTPITIKRIDTYNGLTIFRPYFDFATDSFDSVIEAGIDPTVYFIYPNTAVTLLPNKEKTKWQVIGTYNDTRTYEWGNISTINGWVSMPSYPAQFIDDKLNKVVYFRGGIQFGAGGGGLVPISGSNYVPFELPVDYLFQTVSLPVTLSNANFTPSAIILKDSVFRLSSSPQAPNAGVFLGGCYTYR
jgi:hypothetical protein